MALTQASIDPSPFRALVADDQPHILEALRVLLKQYGCDLEMVTSTEGILRAMAGQEFDVLLMDLNYARDTTSGQEATGETPAERRTRLPAASPGTGAQRSERGAACPIAAITTVLRWI